MQGELVSFPVTMDGTRSIKSTESSNATATSSKLPISIRRSTPGVTQCDMLSVSGWKSRCAPRQIPFEKMIVRSGLAAVMIFLTFLRTVLRYLDKLRIPIASHTPVDVSSRSGFRRGSVEGKLFLHHVNIKCSLDHL